MLRATEKGSLVYIENQYFYDRDIISEIRKAAKRDAKIIVVKTSKPDEGTPLGKEESLLEEYELNGELKMNPLDYEHVALLTLGNSRCDPRHAGGIITSETYVHSKTMAVIGQGWAQMTGGSANISPWSMWFHSEMNIAIADTTQIKNWIAQLWMEHLQISIEKAMDLIGKPEEAFRFFNDQARDNGKALEDGRMPEGRIYDFYTKFPARKLDGIEPFLPVEEMPCKQTTEAPVR